MAKNLTVHLEDRPGALAELGEALGKSVVNIDGICGVSCEGVGVLHILVADAAAARVAAEQAGFAVHAERDVLVVNIVDRPGELGNIARKLANAGINLDLLYLTANLDLVIGVDDLEKAQTAL
ncbi:MAG: amino acid-binding protein [Anaerolineales bacterium]|nr:amino acid-binding protein [Anaerolineales bacterium]